MRWGPRMYGASAMGMTFKYGGSDYTVTSESHLGFVMVAKGPRGGTLRLIRNAKRQDMLAVMRDHRTLLWLRITDDGLKTVEA